MPLDAISSDDVPLARVVPGRRLHGAERVQQEVQYRFVGENGNGGGDDERQHADDDASSELTEVLPQRHVVRGGAVLPLGRERKRDHRRAVQFRVGSPGTTMPDGWGFRAGGSERNGAGRRGLSGASASARALRLWRRQVRPPRGRRPRRRLRRAAVPLRSSGDGGWNDPSGSSSEDMFERWLSNADGERASRAISERRGQVGHGVAHLGLHPVPEFVEGAPRATDLAGDLGEAVRSQEDDGDHGDHEQLAWVEVEHVPSLYGAVRGTG